MDVKTVLERMGFSQNEIKVYLMLNDYGSAKAGKIAKICKIDRSSCYNSLRSLLDKGLASYVLIGKVRWFQATGPRALLGYLKEQQEDVKSIIPELSQRRKAGKIEGQVRLFKGVKGIKSIFRDIATSGDNNLVFGSEGQFGDLLPEFASQFERMKKENSVKTKLLLRDKRGKHDTSMTEYRFLSSIEKSSAVTNIYGDKIAIIIWTDEPEGIVIENKVAANAYRSIFQFMWENADR